ncbi:MAG: hypothetical protein HFH45_01295 [Bacilli bacterium]|nr:hypothetical protein [Bacilli bacterium]
MFLNKKNPTKKELRKSLDIQMNNNKILNEMKKADRKYIKQLELENKKLREQLKEK